MEQDQAITRGSKPPVIAAMLLAGVLSLGSQATAQDAVLQADPALASRIDTMRGELAKALSRAPANTEGRRELRNRLSASLANVAGADDLNRFIVTLTDVSRLSQDGKQDTGFIRDEVVARTLAVTLSSALPDSRELAAKLLLDHATVSQLKACADDVRRGLAGISRGEAIRLEAMLPLTPADARAILQRPDVPPEVRARLGDRQAEQQLIDAFRAAEDFRAKSDLATLLGYVGTDASVKALISEFNSPVVGEFKYMRVSIRCAIILALGRIYPDQPLLTSELRRIIENGDDEYGAGNLRKYLADVAAWAAKTLRVSFEPAALPVFYQKIIYIFPLEAGDGNEERVIETRNAE